MKRREYLALNFPDDGVGSLSYRMSEGVVSMTVRP